MSEYIRYVAKYSDAMKIDRIDTNRKMIVRQVGYFYGLSDSDMDGIKWSETDNK
jgi:predicted Zn-dependent protease with MMP-like domain